MDQFERIKLIVDEDAFSSLQQKQVMVCGVGGVGAIAAETLVRTGITKIILVDYDKVETSNINRQVQANHHTIGMVKTHALRLELEKINPHVEVIEINEFVDENNLNTLMSLYSIDYVIDAIDSIGSKTLLIQYCVEHSIPIISSCGMGNRFDPSLIKISTLGKTFNDPLAKSLRGRLRSKACDKIKVVFSTENPVKREKPVASLAFVVNVAGLFLASEVLKDLGVRKYETQSV